MLRYILNDVVYEGVSGFNDSLAKDHNNALVLVMFDGEPDLWLIGRDNLSNNLDTLKRIYAADWKDTGRKFEAHVYLCHSNVEESF